MPSPLTWDTNIPDSALSVVPTSLADLNVISGSAARRNVAVSATVTGGTDPVVTVTVYFWNPISSTFELSGDVFTLDPSASNVRVLDPNGLTLGLTATSTGSPTSFSLAVGSR